MNSPAPSAEKPHADESRIDQTVDRMNERLKAAADAVGRDTHSAMWRNRRQLAPLALPGGALALGELGALAAKYPEIGEWLATGGTAAAAGGLATGAWFWLRNKLAAKWSLWRTRVTTGVAGAAAWSAAMPLTGDDNGMYLGLMLGTLGLTARWWRANRPGYPEQSDDSSPEVPQQPDHTPTEPAVIGEITPAEIAVEAWNRHVYPDSGPLQGAWARDPRMTETGLAFNVDLVPLKQHRGHVQRQRDALSSALNHPVSAFTFAPGGSQTEVEVRITLDSPHTTGGSPYIGPRIVEEDGNIYVELGPYSDGEGFERWLVATPSGVAHGFAVGSTGSGKSRLLDVIAIALRKLGYEIWYLDPQSGASSAALRDEADWPLLGLHEGTRQFGNVCDLLNALQRVKSIRNTENGAAKRTGFTHSPQRPAIAVIIDECHEVMNAHNPETGNKFGKEFGNLARVTRKLGISFIMGSQTFTLPTFGGADGAALRDALIAGNCVIMRVADRTTVGTVPNAGKIKPWDLPEGGGYGYSTTSARPNVVWRGQNPEDPGAWLRHYPPAELDERADKAAGDVYQNRFTRFEQQEEATQADLDAFDAATSDVEIASALRTGNTASTPKASRANTATASPGMRSASPATANVGGMPLSPSSMLPALQSPEPQSNDSEAELAERHQQILDLLDEYGSLSTREFAEHLGISEQAVRKRLGPLGEGAYISQTATRGVYALA